MSVHVSSWVWRNADAKGNDLLVLLALADIADDEGVCWPSLEHLAGKTRLHEQTVRSRLQALRAVGALDWEERPGTSNRYRINMSTPTKSTTPTKSASPTNSFIGDRGTKAYTHGGTNSFRGGTVIEPLIDTSGGDVVVIHLPEGPKSTRDRRPLPNPFKLTQSMRDWAAQVTPSLAVDAVTAEFVAYWRVGEGAGMGKKAWTLAWCNWLKKEHKRNVEQGWKQPVDDDKPHYRSGRRVN